MQQTLVPQLPPEQTSLAEPTPAASLESTSETGPEIPFDAGDLLLVYTRGGELWRWQQGQGMRLAAGSVFYPKISPDGKLAAFLRPADAYHVELWVVGVDGAGERRLVSIADLDRLGGGMRAADSVAVNPHTGYQWLPGTRRLAFTTVQVFNGPGDSLLHDLHLVDADSGQIASVFLAGWGGEFRFSPDGAQVALIQPDKIFLANTDGSEYRVALEHSPVNTYSEGRFYAAPRWTSDGSALRVAIPPADSLAAPGQATTLWRIPAASGSPIQEGAVTATHFIDSPVVYAPNLERLAFIRESAQPRSGSRELHLATYDGAGDWTYASDPMLIFVGWAPDSRRFLYTVGDEQALFLGSLDAAPQPLGTELTGAFGLRWVDNRRVIYYIQRNQTFELYLADLTAGKSLLIDTFSGNPPTYDWFSSSPTATGL